MATEYHVIGVFAGEDRSLVFTVVDGVGAPVNVTGWAVSFVVSTVTKTVGSGVTLTTPTSGVVTVALAAADTNALVGGFFYKLRRTDAGLNAVLAYGRLTVAA